jgi:hypothetical protein
VEILFHDVDIEDKARRGRSLLRQKLFDFVSHLSPLITGGEQAQTSQIAGQSGGRSAAAGSAQLSARGPARPLDRFLTGIEAGGLFGTDSRRALPTADNNIKHRNLQQAALLKGRSEDTRYVVA